MHPNTCPMGFSPTCYQVVQDQNECEIPHKPPQRFRHIRRHLQHLGAKKPTLKMEKDKGELLERWHCFSLIQLKARCPNAFPLFFFPSLRTRGRNCSGKSEQTILVRSPFEQPTISSSIQKNNAHMIRPEKSRCSWKRVNTNQLNK